MERTPTRAAYAATPATLRPASLLHPTMALRPGSSASGHSTTSRPASGRQSTLASPLLPPGHVTTAYWGHAPAPAARHFSPSTISTGASGLADSASRPHSGRGAGQCCRHHCCFPSGPAHQVTVGVHFLALPVLRSVVSARRT